jgi:hypothetical protein
MTIEDRMGAISSARQSNTLHHCGKTGRFTVGLLVLVTSCAVAGCGDGSPSSGTALRSNSGQSNTPATVPASTSECPTTGAVHSFVPLKNTLTLQSTYRLPAATYTGGTETVHFTDNPASEVRPLARFGCRYVSPNRSYIPATGGITIVYDRYGRYASTVFAQLLASAQACAQEPAEAGYECIFGGQAPTEPRTFHTHGDSFILAATSLSTDQSPPLYWTDYLAGAIHGEVLCLLPTYPDEGNSIQASEGAIPTDDI